MPSDSIRVSTVRSPAVECRRATHRYFQGAFPQGRTASLCACPDKTTPNLSGRDGSGLRFDYRRPSGLGQGLHSSDMVMWRGASAADLLAFECCYSDEGCSGRPRSRSARWSPPERNAWPTRTDSGDQGSLVAAPPTRQIASLHSVPALISTSPPSIPPPIHPS